MVRTCTVRIYVPCTKYDTHNPGIIYIYIWFRIPLDNVEIICECRNLPVTKTFGTMVKGINCSLYI